MCYILAIIMLAVALRLLLTRFADETARVLCYAGTGLAMLGAALKAVVSHRYERQYESLSAEKEKRAAQQATACPVKADYPDERPLPQPQLDEQRRMQLELEGMRELESELGLTPAAQPTWQPGSVTAENVYTNTQVGRSNTPNWG